MPVVIKTREYDESFYQALGCTIEAADVEAVIEEIF
jgi:hypothetical protein